MNILFINTFVLAFPIPTATKNKKKKPNPQFNSLTPKAISRITGSSRAAAARREIAVIPPPPQTVTADPRSRRVIPFCRRRAEKLKE